MAKATNRCRAPFLKVTGEDMLLVQPPLKKAVKWWWKHTLGQTTSCPIIKADVLREDNSQVVILTFSKPLPSAFAQDSVTKSWIRTTDGHVLNVSHTKIPKDRMWWHTTDFNNFKDIVRDSLQAEPEGKFKAVYSLDALEPCSIYGGRVSFAFRSDGMVTRLDPRTPKVIPEGAIGFFDSSKNRQWLHHPKNVQLLFAYVEYDTFCTFLSDAFVKIPDEHPYTKRLHRALFKIAGLVVPSYVDHNKAFEHDLEWPYAWTADSKKTRGKFEEDDLVETYGKGVQLLCKSTSVGEVTQEFAKTALDMEKLWNAPRHFTAGLASEGELHGLGKKRKRGGSDPPTKFVSSSGGLAFGKSRAADAADAGMGDARPKPSAASSVVEEHWRPPTADEIEKYTKQYQRQGRETSPMPQSTHVVVGHLIKRKPQHAHARHDKFTVQCANKRHVSIAFPVSTS